MAEILSVIWRACDAFKGVIGPARYKDYILSILFVKYLSDTREHRLSELEGRYRGDKVRIDRAMARERFVISENATFDYLHAHRNDSDIGHTINTVLESIADANRAKLHNVFQNIDFSSEANLGQARQRNNRLRGLLEDFADLDLQPGNGDMDIIGDVYECLIERFAVNTGKEAGEFYTPPAVSETLSMLMAPREGDRICDPACGSGSLLIRAGKQVGTNDYALYGQEMDGSTWTLCKMNMFLHEVDAAHIEQEDTIRHPQFVENDALMKFDIVIGNPPFSLDKWGQEIASEDRYARFRRGIPPKGKGDWAFITHMLATAVEATGRVGVVVPHGVLFRGGQEGKIREAVVRENLLDAVIGLPANLFYGTGIPAALMIFDKSRSPGRSVLFIDASCEFEQSANQNRLRPQDIEKIVGAFRERQAVDRYAYPASLREIEESGFGLNIPRYVDALEPEPEIDIVATQEEIKHLEAELAETHAKMNGYLRGLGL